MGNELAPRFVRHDVRRRVAADQAAAVKDLRLVQQAISNLTASDEATLAADYAAAAKVALAHRLFPY